jgi:hypothetical protein
MCVSYGTTGSNGMNDLMSTAFASFDAKQGELNGNALVAEVAVYEKSLAPITSLTELRRLYLSAYQDLATYFLNEYRRVNEHSDDAKTHDLQPWLDQCVPRLATFHSLGLHRHRVRSEPWASDHLYLEACGDLFDRAATDVSDNFRGELAKARAEFVSKRKQKRNERVERATWALIGAIGGIVVSVITALLLHHFRLVC